MPTCTCTIISGNFSRIVTSEIKRKITYTFIYVYKAVSYSPEMPDVGLNSSTTLEPNICSAKVIIGILKLVRSTMPCIMVGFIPYNYVLTLKLFLSSVIVQQICTEESEAIETVFTHYFITFSFSLWVAQSRAVVQSVRSDPTALLLDCKE